METSTWEKVAAIGQVVGAAGTFAAVYVALHLARRSERPKLRLSVGKRLVVGFGEQDSPDILNFTIQNLGLTSAHVMQFGWRVGRWPFRFPEFLARGYAIQTFSSNIYGYPPPYEVPPGQRRTSDMEYNSFFKSLESMTGEPFFSKRWPLLGLRGRPVYAVVHLENGIEVSTRVENGFEKDLHKSERDRLARSEDS